MLTELWRDRYLLGQLIKRDVLLRYRGAMFGVAWMLLSSLFMLTVFGGDGCVLDIKSCMDAEFPLALGKKAWRL